MLNGCQPCNFHMNIVSLIPFLLSVCVSVSQGLCHAGLDLYFHSNRWRLPLPVARFCGVADCLSFWQLSAKGWGNMGVGVVTHSQREREENKCASKERPPAFCLMIPSVSKRAAAYTKTLIDACIWMLINIMCAGKHCVVGRVMTWLGDTQAYRQADTRRLCLIGATVCGALSIWRFQYL